MKRWLFISGIVTIVILIAVWLYLLFFGAPTKEELFNVFNFGDTTDETVIEVPPVVELQEEGEIARLRQLTTRPVIGYTEVSVTASSSPLIYFIEAGTGHMFTIDIYTSVENRTSNITIPGAKKAEVSLDGKVAIITASEKQNSDATIVSFEETGAPRSQSLPGVSSDFSLTQDGELLFARMDNTTTQGRVYNFKLGSSRTLFEIPFTRAVIDWGSTAADTHFVYPRAASRLEGFLYAVRGAVMDRTAISGYGLTSLNRKDYSIAAVQIEGSYQSSIKNHVSGTMDALLLNFIPEKCVFLNSAPSAICGNDSAGTYDITIPDAWFKGIESYADDLWLIELDTNKLTFLAETLATTGRELDITNLKMSPDDTRVYFINKNDQTLWIYEL